MSRISALRALVLYIFILTTPKIGYSWGKLGHQTVATLAAELVSSRYPFWIANKDNLGRLTNVPDYKWKSGAQRSKESTNHWFQIDFYTNDPENFSFPRLYSAAVKKYKESVVTENGTAPWRIKQLYDIALKALKAHDYEKALQMAGTLSHYVGDLAQPLHVSKNYDGGETNNPGIHKFFETTVLEAADKMSLSSSVKSRARKLLSNQSFLSQFDGAVVDVAFEEINRTQAYIHDVIDTDLNLGRGSQGSAAQLEIAQSRMADGVATLVILLERLSQEASLDNYGATLMVTDPAWVVPEFTTKKTKSFYTPTTREAFIASLYDCI